MMTFGIGHIRRIKKLRQQLRCDVLRFHPPARHFFGGAFCRARDLLAGAVVERHHQQKPVVFMRQIFGFLQQRADIAKTGRRAHR